MIDKRYFKKDIYGREIFDHRAYADDEQMRILSQMSQSDQNSKRYCLASHNIFSFLGIRRTSKERTK